MIRRWEEERYQREYNDEATQAAGDAVKDEGYVDQNIDGGNAVGELLRPLDVGEVEVEGTELELVINSICKVDMIFALSA